MASIRYKYDPAKWFLGKPCQRGHLWPGTQLSLRSTYRDQTGKKISHCAGCQCKRDDWLGRFIDNEQSGVPVKFRLGALCKNRHMWEGAPYSLRRATTGKCRQCEIERGSNYDSERARRWYERNREKHKATTKRNLQKRLAAEPEYRLVLRNFSRERKTRMRQSHAVRFRNGEIQQRFEQFGNTCAYCEASGDLHIEHFIPISKGGPHAIGNIIPACQSCNFSKRDHDPQEWYQRQEFYDSKRWKVILAALGKSKAPIHQLPLL